MGPVEDYTFACPYCLEEISMTLDVSGGSKQSLTYDCVVCCRPIAITFRVDQNGVTG